MLQIIGVTFLTVCCSLLLKKERPELHFVLVVFICIYISIELLQFICHYVEDIHSITSFFQQDIPLVFILIKIVGITYISELVSNICKDFGYGAIANQVEFFSKAFILAAGFPILKALFKAIMQIVAI